MDKVFSKKIIFFAFFILVSGSCYLRTLTKDLDFKVFHGAAQRILKGDLKLYDFHRDKIFTYKYSPSFALMVAPMGYLTESTAKKLWSSLSVLAFALAWMAFLAYLKNFYPSLPQSYGVQLLTLFMVLQPVTNNAIQGNINAYLLCLMGGSLYFMSLGRSFLSALLAAIGVSIKLTPGVIFFIFLSKRKYKEMLWFTLLVVLMMVIIPLFYFGRKETMDLYLGWSSVLRDTNHFPFFKYTNQSALVVFSRFLPLDIAGKLHLGINLVLFGFIFNFIWKKEEQKTMLLSFIFILSFSPIAWLEYYIYLLPCYLVLNTLLLQGKFSRAIVLIWLLRLIGVHILLKFVVGRDLSNNFAYYGQHFWGLLILTFIIFLSLDKFKKNPQNFTSTK
jgi:Glycosyltransferase family 87